MILQSPLLDKSDQASSVAMKFSIVGPAGCHAHINAVELVLNSHVGIIDRELHKFRR
jgi:hypothetical protein